MNEYRVKLLPERVFAGYTGWVYVAEAPPQERDEIEVYPVDSEGNTVLESETRVVVTGVDDRAVPVGITATWLD